MQEIDRNIWVVDGPDVVFAGAAMNTRMTIIRLDNGGLWVHSPIGLSPSVRDNVRKLGGPVAAVVAPNKFHYLYIEDWRREFPDAKVFAEQTLINKVPALANAEMLSEQAPELYATNIEQLVLSGNRLFQEVVFFHKSSRCLILTDLMSNLRPEKMSFLSRLFFRFEGLIYPNGGIPRLYKWFTTDKQQAREVRDQLIRWNPSRILFCHGEAFAEPANTVLEREYSYLR